ncbi:MAG TPA: hypothetical protein DD400_00110 [Rhodospirillaceae bacterium]|nr:hypothetical protein [Rhodospirillaceae bacterium]
MAGTFQNILGEYTGTKALVCASMSVQKMSKGNGASQEEPVCLRVPTRSAMYVIQGYDVNEKKPPYKGTRCNMYG